MSAQDRSLFTRRGLLQISGVGCAGLICTAKDALAGSGTAPEGWRTFEIDTQVEVLKPAGETRVWVPGALIGSTPYQVTLSNHYEAPGGTATLITEKKDSLGIISAVFPTGVKPVVMVTSRIATKNWTTSVSEPRHSKQNNKTDLEYFLRPTKLLPTSGIVKTTADSITKNAATDLDKARAIYEWIVERTFRDPKTRGCGIGDIRSMLQSGNLGGKCADLNALYVGLARAAGLPARDVYGIRVAKSELGYKSLGIFSSDATKAQHCRAEVHINGYGWIPVDPADVRKVVLEEPPGQRSLDDDMVKKARTRLFGSWEMNWVAYNFAHDVKLPGSSTAPVNFLMYPQAETAQGRLDSLDPQHFKYEITAKEVSTTKTS